VDTSTQSSGYTPTGAVSQSYEWSLYNLGGLNIANLSSPVDAIASITAAIETVTAQRAEYGAMQNRLQYTISNLMSVSENTVAARSSIEDADFATESAVLAKSQVLQQSGAAMLAQANARPQLVPQLIK
jgi:flagellin